MRLIYCKSNAYICFWLPLLTHGLHLSGFRLVILILSEKNSGVDKINIQRTSRCVIMTVFSKVKNIPIHNHCYLLIKLIQINAKNKYVFYIFFIDTFHSVEVQLLLNRFRAFLILKNKLKSVLQYNLFVQYLDGAYFIYFN